MTLDLTDDETAALVAHLKHAIEYDRFPMAPRLDPLKAMLVKLEPPAVASEPEPLLRSTGHRPGTAGALRKRQRGR